MSHLSHYIGFLHVPLAPKQPLTVRRFDGQIMRDLALPAVPVREQLVLVVEQLLTGFRGEFKVRPLDDGIDRTGFLAETAIDAFRHVDVVAGRPAAAVVTRLGLDGDGLCRADRLTQLAGNAKNFVLAKFQAATAQEDMTVVENERDSSSNSAAFKLQEGEEDAGSLPQAENDSATDSIVVAEDEFVI